MLYPLRFAPIMNENVWGGSRLAATGKRVPKGKNPNKIGESREICGLEDCESVASNGFLKANSISELTEVYMGELVGDKVYDKFGIEFPLLLKFLDVNEPLSVQVHPNDEFALQEHGTRGKTEMWYIIDATPDAAIYLDLKHPLTEKQYDEAVENGTIVEHLNRVAVKNGDAFLIPAGTIHSIDKGVLLAEVQETSDITYRIYDYGRPGLDGKPRELHTELAAQALDFTVHQNYRNTYKDTMDMANLCLDTDHFSVRVLPLNYPMRRNMILYDSFVIITCVHSSCLIHIRSTQDEIELQEGFSCFIPAAIADYDIVPLVGDVKVLEAYINNRPRTTWQRIVSQFMHLSGYDI